MNGGSDKPPFRFICLLLYKFLYPEFDSGRMVRIKITKYILVGIVFIFFGFIVKDSLTSKESFFKFLRKSDSLSAYNNYLLNDAKNVVYNDAIDSFLVSKEFLLYYLSKSGGVTIPPQVPLSHLKQIYRSAKYNNVPLGIIVRVIYQESRFVPQAVNHEGSGAAGYCQMMPGTFKAMCRKMNIKAVPTPENNIRAGSKLLKTGFDYWIRGGKDTIGAWEMSLACYAMGDSLPRIIKRVPTSVQSYVNYVMQPYRK